MNKKAALFTVFLVVLIDLMGFGIVLPLLPFYASKFGASALAVGLLYSVYSLAQLVFSPLWGGFSDRIGRRPIMLLSTFGAVLAYLLFAFSHSFELLFFSRLLAGIMGGNISTAQAYVADVTKPEERAKGMGLIGAAFGIGFTLGPALTALLMHPSVIDQVGAAAASRAWLAYVSENLYAVPGFFAASLSFLSFLLVLFKLPETVRGQADSDPTRIVRAGIFSRAFWASLKESSLASGHLLPLLFLSVFLLSMGQSSLYSAFPLFCRDVLGLPAQKVGMQFAVMGLIAVFIQGGLIRILVKHVNEKKLFLFGNALLAGGLALIPFARSEYFLTLFLSLMAVGGSLNGPTLTSLVSKEAAPQKMGAMMGASQSLSALGRVVGPAWGGALYAAHFRLPFVCTAAVVSVTIFIGAKLLANAAD